LDDVLAIELAPGALDDAFRSFGVGGFFAFSGEYSTPQFGAVQAFVTDPRSTVVVRARSVVIIVSPRDPIAFIQAVKSSRDG
jgi:hypothetical protein